VNNTGTKKGRIVK